MNEVLARLGRGYARMWAWAYGGASRPFRGRGRPVTIHQQETARETRIALELMAETAGADDMTDEQRIFMAQSAPGMRAREAHLLTIPNRSTVEEGELQMIRREMTRIEGRNDPGPGGPGAGSFTRLWDAPPPPERPAQSALYRVGSVLIGLGQWLPILFIVGAVFAITGWGSAIWNGVKIGWLERRVEQLTEQRDAACSLSEMEGDTSRAACRQLAQMHMQAVENARIARAQAAATAANIEAERRRSRAVQRREQERQRATQDLLVNDTPPDWGGLLRNDEPGESADPVTDAPGRDPR